VKGTRSLFGCGLQVLAVSAKRFPRGSGLFFNESSGNFLLRRAPPAKSSYFETHYVYFKILLGADLPLQALKCGTVEFLDLPAMETRQMQMVFLCLDLVVMFFSVEVHQVQLIDQSHALQQLKRPVDGRAINLGIPLASPRQQGGRVQMGICTLNGFDQRAPLRGQTNASRFQLI
jgi:hypothetical protein